MKMLIIPYIKSILNNNGKKKRASKYVYVYFKPSLCCVSGAMTSCLEVTEMQILDAALGVGVGMGLS